MESVQIISMVCYVISAPLLGLLLAGADRIISARMQRRKGPPILQPYYDVRKLADKERPSAGGVQEFYVLCSLIFMVITGAVFFAGGDLMLAVFMLMLSTVLLLVAAFSSNSPYSQIGAERELYLTMAYEPMVLFTAIGFYVFSGSFRIIDIATGGSMPIVHLFGIFIGFVFILTIKLRKSPFDIGMSHHAHQELVKGISTEFSGKTLAMTEIIHWYENILLLGFIILFFCDGSILGYVIGLAVCISVYVFEILIDNSFARMKWQSALKSAWPVALVFGLGNIIVLFALEA
ncbi:MAG: NADH-quinone oxidoreductase subunit H [Candidatus Methanoplasma sp.]|jgi:formate hydrogenlyase subunit 4|nr:NADH-quinone oxidoreductase subunit H [Candidatus Methanoplasma sp.]